MSAVDAGRGEARSQLGDGALDVALAALPPRVEQLGQLAEALGLERLEREVLELPLHLPDPEPLGQRRVDLHRLAGDPLLLLDRQGVQRPHVVEPVGELDEDDPDVLGHRQQHLPDVLGLLLLVAVGGEARQLGHAVDELGDLRPEALLDVGQAVLGVLRDVVEERGLDRGRVEAELGQDLGRGDRVGDVRLAAGPLLALVGGDREVERAVDRLEVRAGMLREDRRVELASGARRGRGRALPVSRGDDGRASRTAPRRRPCPSARRGAGCCLRAWSRACHTLQGYAQP